MKNLRLTVCSEKAEVKLSMPMHTQDEEAFSMLASHWAWIMEQRALALQKIEHNQCLFFNGEQHTLWGEQLPLRLRTVKRKREREVYRTNGHNLVLACTETCGQAQKEQLLDKFYRRELDARIEALLDRWQVIVGKNVTGWTLKKMRSRWGSCNIESASFSINIELVKWPPTCLEYVLVHELTHLHERNHNRRFYRLMDEYMPTWRQIEKRLKLAPVVLDGGPQPSNKGLLQ